MFFSKKRKMEKIALMLDKAQKKFTMDLIRRLSDPDICERKACAEYINDSTFGVIF